MLWSWPDSKAIENKSVTEYRNTRNIEWSPGVLNWLAESTMMDTVSSLRQSTVLRASRLHQSKPKKIPRFLNTNTISLFTILWVVCQVMLPLCFWQGFHSLPIRAQSLRVLWLLPYFPTTFFLPSFFSNLPTILHSGASSYDRLLRVCIWSDDSSGRCRCVYK